jgi:hypothetical protein
VERLINIITKSKKCACFSADAFATGWGEVMSTSVLKQILATLPY